MDIKHSLGTGRTTMYKKSEKCACNTSLLMTDQKDDHFGETRDLACHSRKKITRKFIKISSLINTFCILLAAGNSSAWAHGGGGFHGGWGGGFHGQGGFEWGNNSRESAGMYHRNNNYSAWGASGGYRESEHYRGLGGSSYGTMQPFQEHHPQTIHPFNQASSVTGHIDGFHHGEYANKEFAGNANWINHNNWHGNYWHGSYWHGSYWHGSYWHGSYWHGSYWTGGAYWGPGPYWGWGNGFFYGALFGATLTTALYLPPVYADYYYSVPLYYYPGPYDYTILVSNYSAVPTPPLRPAPQKVETWVPVKNGHIPVNAVLNNIVNKKTTYYCRVKFHGNTSYGVLIPNDGCYVEEPSVTMRFSKYDILVSTIVG